MQLARLKIYAKLQFEILGYWRLRKWEKFGLESRIEYEEPLSLKKLAYQHLPYQMTLYCHPLSI